jgi:ribosomal protein L18E
VVGLVFREVQPLTYLLVGFRTDDEFISKSDGLVEFSWSREALEKLREAGCLVVTYRSGKVPRLL